MRSVSFAFVAALALAAPGAYAANLADVYDAAAVNDPVIGAAKEDYAARKELVPQTRAGLLPSINLNGQSSKNRLDFPGGNITDTNPASPTYGQTFSIPGQNYDINTWQAQVVQPLLDLQAYFAYRSAQASSKSAGFDYDAAQQELIFRVVQAYLNVLRAQDLVDSTRAEEAAVKRQQEQVKQRFDVGLVAITDVLDATAAYDNSVVQRIVAEQAQGNSFETLYTLTGNSYEELDRIGPRLPIVSPDPIDEHAWVQTALANNPTVLSFREQQLAAERNVRGQESGHLPTVDALASYNHYDSNSPLQTFGKTETKTYALQFQLPIYQGGYTSSKVREARHRLVQSGDLLRNQEWTVSRDVRTLLRDVTIDVQRVQARLNAIKSAESSLEATQTGYEVGTRNIVDVLQAQQRLYASQFDLADSRYQYMIDLVQLKQTTGVIVPADLADLNSFADKNRTVRRIESVTLSRTPSLQ